MHKTLTLRLKEDVYNILAEIAKAENRSLANFIETAALRRFDPPAASGQPGKQAEQRPVIIIFECHGGVLNTLLLPSEHFYLAVMRRCNDRRRRGQQFLQRSDGQRRSLIRIGPVPDLVDQAQRVFPRRPAHLVQVPEMRGKRAQ